MKIEITKYEADALSTPIFVALANAQLELQKARIFDIPPVIEWLEARVSALDKLMEALSAVKVNP